MINRVVLMGRLTADPELRTTTSGLAVAAFGVAVDRRYAENGERKADFINCVAWRKAAEFLCKYFFKGDMIAVEGSLQSRKYEDKNGNLRTVYEVVADNLSFCGGKREQEQAAAPAPAPQQPVQPAPVQQQQRMDLSAMAPPPPDDDDLPF